jgi:undecaprenyl phosphate-alpha-L-ara4N flippase subunit ArnE
MSKWTAIGFMLLSALFATVGQLFYKTAADKIHLNNMFTFILNPYVYAGVAVYFIGLFFMIKSLRRGELTVVYPVMATSFIWVSLLSPLFFQTDFMTTQKWIGVAVIVLGISLIGAGADGRTTTTKAV